MMNRKKITVVEYRSDTGLFWERNSVLLLLLLLTKVIDTSLFMVTCMSS